MNIREFIKYLDQFPNDTEVWCVADECFANGDKAPDYFPVTPNELHVIDGILYIGDVEI